MMRTKHEIKMQWNSPAFPGGSHGEITIPAGTRVEPAPAGGSVKEGEEFFVTDLDWLKPKFLHHDAEHRGIRVPASECEEVHVLLAKGKIRAMNESELLVAIQDKLDGVEWTAETLSDIADLLNANGFRVRDLNEEVQELDEELTKGKSR